MKRSKRIDVYLKEHEFRNNWYAWVANTDGLNDKTIHLCRESYKAGYKLGLTMLGNEDEHRGS